MRHAVAVTGLLDSRDEFGLDARSALCNALHVKAFKSPGPATMPSVRARITRMFCGAEASSVCRRCSQDAVRGGADFWGARNQEVAV